MPLTSNRELHELLLIEEADAWFEYADATKDQRGSALLPRSSPGPGRASSSGFASSARGARASRRPTRPRQVKPPSAALAGAATGRRCYP